MSGQTLSRTVRDGSGLIGGVQENIVRNGSERSGTINRVGKNDLRRRVDDIVRNGPGRFGTGSLNMFMRRLSFLLVALHYV